MNSIKAARKCGLVVLSPSLPPLLRGCLTGGPLGANLILSQVPGDHFHALGETSQSFAPFQAMGQANSALLYSGPELWACVWAMQDLAPIV